MKRFISCLMVLSCCLIINYNAFCSETYYIDGNRVLLYKIINWWYDCLPEKSNLLCGNSIKYQNQGESQVEFNETESRLKFQIYKGFAKLLSIGPSYLKCTWLNKKYFGNGKAAIVSNTWPSISPFIINNINKRYGRQIQDIQKDIMFELDGVIEGLQNGKIALDQEGNFLKTCPKASHNNDNAFPVFVRIINSKTEEVLAKYIVVSDY